MKRVVRLTEQQLTGLLKDIMGIIGGTESQSSSTTPKTDTLAKSNTSSSTNSVSTTPGNVVGSQWKSCQAWKSKGGLSFWSNNIKVEKSPSQFKISYQGPSSGLSIAHAANGKDTIHQLFNVLICELNPFLAEGKMKPNITSIKTEGGKNDKGSTLTITVPLEKSDETYQIDRRGGWGHDPGASKMDAKCKEINSKGGKCFGPVKNITDAKFGKITEYFITHTI